MYYFHKNFVRDGPGRWTCVTTGNYRSAIGRIPVFKGTTYIKGTSIMGIDVVALLDEEFLWKNRSAGSRAAISSRLHAISDALGSAVGITSSTS